ncbi:MAG: carboxypeptidase regulatory-like domain-containing protein [Pyrinomonadaceae bacterium]
MKFIRPLFLFGIISMLAVISAFAQGNGSLTGTVTDANGAIIVGATVSALSATGARKDYISNSKGEYTINGLAPGKYTVKAIAPKFGLYENTEVVIAAGEKNEMFIVLTVAGIEENVDVSVGEGISNDPENNKDATVLKEKDIEALPDDPDEMQAALQALAGGAAGPNGGQIYIDGFTGGQMPTKDQIREIRINSNPFSAEYDRIGFGRVEILTRPGSDKFRGSLNGSFNDESLNSRNPFAANRAPTQSRNFGGNYSGPIKKGKASFFIDVNNRQNDDSSIINAQILDASLNIIPFRQDVTRPNRRFSFSPRIDFAINDKNTMVVRYNFGSGTSKNQGIGDTSLLSRAYSSTNKENELRLTETMIINAKTVNETRFEYSDNENKQSGDNSIPTINVSSSFTGGGASIGNSFNRNKTVEINNFTSTSFGASNSFKFGGKLRHVNVINRAENNYAGTYLFPGICPTGGTCTTTSIDQYRQKLLGNTSAIYNPTQFSISTGTPEIAVKQTEIGLFATDDWKISPALLLSFGLRYENQTNISSKFNFAPRFGFAWSPGAGGARTPKMVFRGGAGVFYERFGQNNTLQALRNNGVNQLSLLVSANDTDPIRRAIALTLLAQPVFTTSGVTNSLTVAQILAVLPQTASSIRDVADNLQAPYTMQAAMSMERSFASNKFNLATTFMTSRTIHAIRTRNYNAPVCATATNCVGAVRPIPTMGNVNVYESSGILNMNRINVNFRANISQKYSITANYGLGFMKGDEATPAYMYDFTGEYGRAGGDVRHQLNIIGNVTLPWGVNMNPFVTIRSGNPFNITTGTDSNGDGFQTERPTFGQLQATCLQRNITASFCDIGNNSLTAIVPRNYGEGPKSVTFNLNLRKNFGFGKTATQRAANAGGGAAGGPGGGGMSVPQMVMASGGPGGGGGGMMRGGGGGGFGGGDVRKPYNLSVGINVQNIFNIVNLNTPTGNLSSSRFGQSTSTGGSFGGFGGFGSGGASANRRIELNMRFNW